MVFWHPKGWTIWQQVEQYMRRVYRDNGYQEVQGAADPRPRAVGEDPATGRTTSDNMFTTESEKRDYALKPMNCPGHILIFNSGMRSYRDLPLRYGEFGQCHRNEPSGALHGIMRVRGFTQDDGHIFCTEEQIQAECVGLHRAAAGGLRGLRLHGHRDTRSRRGPTTRIGADETWDRAEEALREALRACGVRMDRARRARARSTGPKIEYHAEGRDRPPVAVRHDAGRFPDARAAGRRVRRRGRHAARSR